MQPKRQGRPPTIENARDRILDDAASLFAREAVERAMATPLAEGLRIESDLSTLAYQTQDAEEGMRAFVEKRTPEFKDA